jgi:hypothetical protein
MFNGRLNSLETVLFHEVTYDHDSLILQAGEAQGVRQHQVFQLVTREGLGHTAVAEAHVTLVKPYSSVLKLRNDRRPRLGWSSVPQTVAAISSGPPRLRLSSHLSTDPYWRIESIDGVLDYVCLVGQDERPTLSLSWSATGVVAFYIEDWRIKKRGMLRVTESFHFVADSESEERMRTVLSGAAHFYHHFRLNSAKASFMKCITPAAYILGRTTSDEGTRGWLPVDYTNQIFDNTVEVEHDDIVYGFSIKNKSQEPLFAWAFLFELADFSVGRWKMTVGTHGAHCFEQSRYILQIMRSQIPTAVSHLTRASHQAAS